MSQETNASSHYFCLDTIHVGLVDRVSLQTCILLPETFFYYKSETVPYILLQNVQVKSPLFKSRFLQDSSWINDISPSSLKEILRNVGQPFFSFISPSEIWPSNFSNKRKKKKFCEID